MVAEGDYSAANPAAGKDLIPYFQVSQADRNDRQDTQGGFIRSYNRSKDDPPGSVTVEAQQRSGYYRFVKWTDPFGVDLGLSPLFRDGGYKGPMAATDPAITLDLTDHRTVRAQYLHLAIPENLSPADGAAPVWPEDVLLDWTDTPDSTSYELYVWPQIAPRPATPTATGLTASQYLMPARLNDLTGYFWQIIAQYPGGDSRNGYSTDFLTDEFRTHARDFDRYR